MPDYPPPTRPDQLPKPNELCVISQRASMRRDALLFDRLYVPTTTPDYIDVPPDEITFGMYDVDRQAFHLAEQQGLTDPRLIRDALVDFGYDYVQNFRTRFTSDFYGDKGIVTTPSYRSDLAFAHEFPEGEDIAIQAVINNVQVLNERETSWEQVMDFRADLESMRKYRNLRIWLAEGLNADGVQHATDVIGRKLDDYEWSLRKHGIQTVTGALSQVFTWKQSAITATATASAGALGGPIAAALVGGLFFSAQTCIGMAERRITLEEIKRGPNSEVAVLHDINAQFGTQ